MVQSAPFPHDSRSFHFTGKGILPLLTLQTPQEGLTGPATHRSLNPFADRVVFSISPDASECLPQQVGPRGHFVLTLEMGVQSQSGRRPGMLRPGQSFLSLLFRSDFLLLLDHRPPGGGLHLGSQSAGRPGVASVQSSVPGPPVICVGLGCRVGFVGKYTLKTCLLHI